MEGAAAGGAWWGAWGPETPGAGAALGVRTGGGLVRWCVGGGRPGRDQGGAHRGDVCFGDSRDGLHGAGVGGGRPGSAREPWGASGQPRYRRQRMRGRGKTGGARSRGPNFGAARLGRRAKSGEGWATVRGRGGGGKFVEKYKYTVFKFFKVYFSCNSHYIANICTLKNVSHLRLFSLQNTLILVKVD